MQDGFKQRTQIAARLVRVEGRRARAGAGVNDRGIELAFVRAEVDHQVERLIIDLFAARVRTIHLVDDDDDRQAERQRMLEHETGLRHRTLESIDEEEASVCHVEHALNLTTEVRVSRSIEDINLSTFPIDRYIL